MRILLISLQFLVFSMCSAQSGLTFEKVVSIHDFIFTKSAYTTASGTSGYWKSTDSSSQYFDSDTLTVPSGKIWKIEFLDFNNSTQSWQLDGIGTCGSPATSLPRTCRVYGYLKINGMTLANFPNNTPIWLNSGDKIIFTMTAQETKTDCWLWESKSSAVKSVYMSYHLSALEFSVQ